MRLHSLSQFFLYSHFINAAATGLYGPIKESATIMISSCKYFMAILLIVINTIERVLLKSHLNIIFFSNPQTGVDGSRCGTPVLMQLQPEAKKWLLL